MERVDFARASDGVLIAYSSTGEGPPLVSAPGWVSHLEVELENPAVATFYEQLGNGGRRGLIRFDPRGCGLSDREVADLSCSARARDFEGVIDHAGLERTNVIAHSMSGPPAIVYAATHPDRVEKLILCATFARGHQRSPALGRAVVDLIRAEWTLGSRSIVDIVHPNADKETADQVSRLFKAAASAETAAAILEESLFHVDVRPYLSRLTMPVLVIHRRDDRAFDFEHGRELAALIPNARLQVLSGEAHVASHGDTQAMLEVIGDFLGDRITEGGTPPAREAAGLQIILFTDMEGSTTLTQRLGDAGAHEVLRVHDGVLRDALRRHGGSEVKHTGDGMMATFSSASGAIECAIAVQRGLAAHTASHPETPIRVRIGLNAGEPVSEGEDLFGTAVQAAARITARAEPGQILAADVVRQLAAGKGFVFADRGRVTLRGFRQRYRLYEIRWAA